MYKGGKLEEICKRNYEIDKEMCERLIIKPSPIPLHYKCYNITEVESETRLPVNVTLYDNLEWNLCKLKNLPSLYQAIKGGYRPIPVPPPLPIKTPLPPVVTPVPKEEITPVSEEVPKEEVISPPPPEELPPIRAAGLYAPSVALTLASTDYETCVKEIEVLYRECLTAKTGEECKREYEVNLREKCEPLRQAVPTPVAVPTLKRDYDECVRECEVKISDLEKAGVSEEDIATFKKRCISECEGLLPKEIQISSELIRSVRPHYKCYDIEEIELPGVGARRVLQNVTLIDQFGVETVFVLKPTLLCTQAKKEIGIQEIRREKVEKEILPPAPVQEAGVGFEKCLENAKLRYLECEKVEEVEKCKRDFEIAISAGEKLKPPIAPPPITLMPVRPVTEEIISHYKCYTIKEIKRNYTLPLVVNVSDRFGFERLNVYEPLLLCTPAVKQEHFKRAVIGEKLVIEGREALGEKLEVKIEDKKLEIVAGKRLNITHKGTSAIGDGELEYIDGKLLGKKSRKELKILPADVEMKLGRERLKKLTLIDTEAEFKYRVEAEKHGMILWVFPISFEVKYEVDASTGAVIRKDRPWWDILVTKTV